MGGVILGRIRVSVNMEDTVNLAGVELWKGDAETFNEDAQRVC